MPEFKILAPEKRLPITAANSSLQQMGQLQTKNHYNVVGFIF